MPLRYVALGDSYTICSSVDAGDRWPDRLVEVLGPDEPALRLVANLGVNGYTTDDLIQRELPALDRLQPEFVSLLIGVNDVVRGFPLIHTEGNLRVVLDDLVRRVGAARIVTVTVPDYTVTPAGADYGDPRHRHAGIVGVNEAVAEASVHRGIAVVDIFDISLRAADDRALVADDGLHPSGAQYALWVERIAPVVSRLIGR